MAERFFWTGHGLAYALLAPLAVLAIVIWLPDEHWAGVIALVFAVLSAMILWLFPRDLDVNAHSRQRWFGSAVGALLVALLATMTSPASIPIIIIGLLCLWLLRLWYIRQFHRQRAQRDHVELLRRCLLITLWSHISVITALWSPYSGL